MWKHQQWEWSSYHPITITKKNKHRKRNGQFYGSISLFSFYLGYLHRLGKIEYIQYRYVILLVTSEFSTQSVINLYFISTVRTHISNNLRNSPIVLSFFLFPLFLYFFISLSLYLFISLFLYFFISLFL